ncbi:MAG: helix-turn-helix domain-containing protein [Hyphomonadaceae bacterium]
MSALAMDMVGVAAQAAKLREVQSFAPEIDAPSVVAPFARNEEIFAEEEPTKYVYKVVSGAVRLIRILSDGRRHISAFYLPGEVFGFEPGEAHRFSAEAVVDSRIAMVRRAAIEDAACADARVGRAMWRLAAIDLQNLNEHMLLLGRMSATERVSAFLIELSARMGAGECIDLPMSRSDIGDYLGLTIETVSRTFTQLERDGAIAMPSARKIIVRNRARLNRCDA